MTEFQQRVKDFVSEHPGAGAWKVAQGAFPEKWEKASGRGALVGHIDRAAEALGLIRVISRGRYPIYFPKPESVGESER